MRKIILAGYGGQGMMLCGQILAYAAMLEDKYSTWVPSYGPEMRGGSAHCHVIVSDKPIGSPLIPCADVLVAMNQPSYDKFEELVAPGGTLIYNSSIISAGESRTDIHYATVDCARITEELNNPKVGNMVALGALNTLIGCVKEASIKDALKYKLGYRKEDLLHVNIRAIEAGRKAVIA